MSETVFWALFVLLSLVTLLLLISLLYLTQTTMKSSREKDRLIQSLANLVSSKDAMTYAALQANVAPEEPNEIDPYVSKSDEDEAAQWQRLTGLDDDDSADLRELGLRN